MIDYLTIPEIISSKMHASIKAHSSENFINLFNRFHLDDYFFRKKFVDREKVLRHAERVHLLASLA